MRSFDPQSIQIPKMQRMPSTRGPNDYEDARLHKTISAGLPRNISSQHLIFSSDVAITAAISFISAICCDSRGNLLFAWGSISNSTDPCAAETEAALFSICCAQSLNVEHLCLAGDSKDNH
ncbi:hypothetical protein CDL15_Pgr022030 [Punica granatum]|nr:hypothetical protein CDL15_Pgr022030 [Punica granatum]